MLVSEEERKTKAREKNKERMKEYNKRPEVKAKMKEYNASPERKAKMREHYARPETKTKMKEYRARPETKAKIKARTKVYRARPEVQAQRSQYAKEYYARPEVKARMKEYDKLQWSIPEVKAKIKTHKKAYRARPEVKLKRTESVKEKKDNVKMEVYLHYSKIYSNSDIPCCRCCGLNNHIEFLSLDHIGGRKKMDSESELVKLGYSSKLKIHQLLPWIKKNNFPQDFQILCLNCNFAKGHSKDNTCPHERTN